MAYDGLYGFFWLDVIVLVKDSVKQLKIDYKGVIVVIVR